MASTLKKAADMAKKVLTKTPVAAKNALTKTPASGKGALEKTPVAGKGDLTKEPPTKLPYSQQALEAFKFTEFPYYVEREWWKRTHRMTFWATWRQLRDVKRRELLAELGPERMRLKAIKFNTVLPQALRDECADKLSNMPKYSHPALILNMCMFTARQRGKIKPYRLNRHLFRKAADHGQLSGVQRAIWGN